MADRSNFSIFAEGCIASYFNMFNALLTRSPRIKSAINLILRGDVGALCKYTVEGPTFAASFTAWILALLATDPFTFFSVSI
jgi:hypothetical protein